MRPMNPIISFRESLGLERLAFAKRFGLPYSSYANLELGYPDAIPPKAKRALTKAGADPEALDRLYRAWRANGLG